MAVSLSSQRLLSVRLGPMLLLLCMISSASSSDAAATAATTTTALIDPLASPSSRVLEGVGSLSRSTDTAFVSAQTIDESSSQPAHENGPVLMIVLVSVALVCVLIVAGFFVMKNRKQSAGPSDSPALSAPRRFFFIKAEPNQPSLPSLADGTTPTTAMALDEMIVPVGSGLRGSYERDIGLACQDSFVRFNDSPRQSRPVRARGSSSSFWGSFMNSSSIASLSSGSSCQAVSNDVQSPRTGFEDQVRTPASQEIELLATQTSTRSVIVTTFVNRLLGFKLKRAVVQTDATQSEGFFV